MRNLTSIYSKLGKKSLSLLGIGLFLFVSGLSEFLPGFNGPIGMLIISVIFLGLGYQSAKTDLGAMSAE